MREAGKAFGDEDDDDDDTVGGEDTGVLFVEAERLGGSAALSFSRSLAVMGAVMKSEAYARGRSFQLGVLLYMGRRLCARA